MRSGMWINKVWTSETLFTTTLRNSNKCREDLGEMSYITTAVYSCCVCETQRYESVITDHLPTSPKPHFFSLFAAIFNWCSIRFLASAIHRDTRRVTCEVHISRCCSVCSWLYSGRTAYFGISVQRRPFLQQKPLEVRLKCLDLISEALFYVSSPYKKPVLAH